jgi:hypothetical protein
MFIVLNSINPDNTKESHRSGCCAVSPDVPRYTRSTAVVNSECSTLPFSSSVLPYSTDSYKIQPTICSQTQLQMLYYLIQATGCAPLDQLQAHPQNLKCSQNCNAKIQIHDSWLLWDPIYDRCHSGPYKYVQFLLKLCP